MDYINQKSHIYYDSFKKYNDEHSSLYLDLNVNETFENSDVYNYLGILPYKNDWIGFIQDSLGTSWKSRRRKFGEFPRAGTQRVPEEAGTRGP